MKSVIRISESFPSTYNYIRKICVVVHDARAVGAQMDYRLHAVGLQNANKNNQPRIEETCYHFCKLNPIGIYAIAKQIDQSMGIFEQCVSEI